MKKLLFILLAVALISCEKKEEDYLKDYVKFFEGETNGEWYEDDATKPYPPEKGNISFYFKGDKMMLYNGNLVAHPEEKYSVEGDKMYCDIFNEHNPAIIRIESRDVVYFTIDKDYKPRRFYRARPSE